MFPDMGATQEMTIDYAAGMAEAATGGVKINYIPRKAATPFRGSFFATGVNSSFQGDNFSDDLQARGLTQVNSLKKAYDVNGSVGGPIVQDKLWFFASARRQVNETYLAGLYVNLNAGDPTKWTYEPDLAQQADTFIIQPDVNGRLTWQATPKNKFSFFYAHQLRDVFGDRASRVARVGERVQLTKGNLASASWSSPVTTRLLLDARLATHGEALYNAHVARGSQQRLAGADRRHRTGRQHSRAALSRRRPGGRADVHLRRDGRAHHLGSDRLAVLRDRRARVQGRVPQLVGHAGTARARHRLGHQLPLQQRRAEPDHACARRR